MSDRGGQLPQGRYAHDMRQVRLRVAQCLIDVLALRQIEYEGNALLSAVVERRRTDQNGHAGAVFAKVLFLTRLDGATRLQLFDGLFVGVAPIGRARLRPSE